MSANTWQNQYRRKWRLIFSFLVNGLSGGISSTASGTQLEQHIHCQMAPTDPSRQSPEATALD